MALSSAVIGSTESTYMMDTVRAMEAAASGRFSSCIYRTHTRAFSTARAGALWQSGDKVGALFVVAPVG